MLSRDSRFKPGQSGNPKGRPKGARNRLAVEVDELLRADASDIVRVAIEKAKAGDAGFVRLILDRIVPPAKDRPITFDLPDIETPDDAAKAAGAILRAVASGEVTPSEASDVVKLLDGFANTLLATELEHRLSALEKDRPGGRVS